MEIIKVLEDHDILPKGITKTAKNEVNSQRGGLLPILLGGLASSLIANFLSKELFGGSGIKRAGEGIKKKSLMPSHPLTKIEIQDYFKNERRFNGVFSRDNFQKTIKKEHMPLI